MLIIRKLPCQLLIDTGLRVLRENFLKTATNNSATGGKLTHRLYNMRLKNIVLILLSTSF